MWHCVAVRGHDARLIGAPSCELCLTHPHIILHAFYSFAVFGGSEDADRGISAPVEHIEVLVRVVVVAWWMVGIRGGMCSLPVTSSL